MSAAAGSLRGLLTELRGQSLYNLMIRAASLLTMFLAVALLRGAKTADFLAVTVLASVAQLAGQYDLGLGYLGLDLGAHGWSLERVKAAIVEESRKTRPARRVVAVLVGAISAGLLWRQAGDGDVVWLLVALGLQVHVVIVAMLLGPFERAAIGAKNFRWPAIGGLVGFAASVAVAGAASIVHQGIAPLALIVVFGPVHGARIAGFLAMRKLPGDDVRREDARQTQRRRTFGTLQWISVAAFGADQAIAAAVSRPDSFEVFAAHTRYQLLVTGVFTAVVTAIWPALVRLMKADGGEAGRRHYRMLIVAIPALAAVAMAPLLIGPDPVSFIRSGQRRSLGVAIPIAVSFVMLQAGAVVGQVCVALSNTDLLVGLSKRMAVLNVLASVPLALWLGPVGVVYGTLLSYPLAVLVPLLRALSRPEVWEGGGFAEVPR